ncbi:MAG: ribosome recycling factor [Gemmatimonadota bacterium]|nr:ribosome recycling factor [Gemmatimonadota bacterium]MDE2677381.1 ribosome recycling factor [Gemmatimonadota bacterium]
MDDARRRMDASLDAVEREFATVRTGKAVPSILDTVRVSAYGGIMPLNQVATVSAPDPSLLVIQPFDRSLAADIEKAVLTSGLGLNPSNDGVLIRVPIPPLSEERRKEYVKLLHRMAEEGRVSVRQARHAANDRIKQRLRDHEIGEDDAHRTMANVQKLTDEYCGRIDALLASKEREVMAI